MTFTRLNSTDPANLAFLMNRLGDEILASTASSWAELPGKPAAYPPTPHTHAWGAIQGRPAVFPPSQHRHAIDDVAGLRSLIQELGSISGDPEDTETLAALLVRMGIVEGNVDQLETLAESLVRTTDERLTDARTPLEHQHTPADVTGLEDLLATLAQGIDALTPSPWVDLALVSPWVPYSETSSSYYAGVRARRTPAGVQIQGMVKGGGENTQICNLPASLAPAFGGHFASISNSLPATVFISNGGQIRYLSGGSSTSYVSINLVLPLP